MKLTQPLENYRTCWALVLIIIITCTVVPARIFEWPSPGSLDWLSVLITLEFIVGIGILARLETKRLTDKDEKKRHALNSIALFFVVAGFLMIAYFIEKIEVKDIVTVLVLFGTVLITAEYANETTRIAEANIRMADEMKEQRFDSLRPIIDIDWIERLGDAKKTQNTIHETAEVGYFISDGKIPDKLTCIIRNIGVGPATDVRLYIQPEGDERLRSFGSIPKDTTIHDGDFKQWPISIKTRNGHSYLLVYYTDTFGQYFETSRRIDIDETKRYLIIEPLMVRKLDKNKDKDIISSIWPILNSEVSR